MSVLQQFSRLFTPKEKQFFLLLIVLLSISALLEMAGIGLLIGAAGVFLTPGSELVGELNKIIRTDRPEELLTYFLAVTAGCFVFKTLYTLLVIHLSSNFIYLRGSKLSSRIFSNYLNADYASISRESVAALSLNLKRCSDFCTLLLMPELQLISDLLVITLTIAVLSCLLPMETLFAATALGAGGLLIYWLPRKLNLALGQHFRQSEKECAALGLEALNDLAYIKSTADYEKILNDYRNCCVRQFRCHANLYSLGQIPRLLLECLVLLIAIGSMALMLALNWDRNTVLLTFSAFAAVASRLLPAISRAHYNSTLVRQNRHLFSELVRAASDDRCEVLSDGSGDYPAVKHQLELKNISYRFPESAKPVLDHLDLTVPAGTICGIVGKTGCGKSTLLELLCGLRHPETGEILADGVNIFCNLRSWRSIIGYVPQHVRLRAGSVRENLLCGRTDLTDEELLEALALAQLPEFELDKIISPDDGNLSGGQIQRLGIARALCRKVELLLLDEVTSALDNETENRLTEALDSLRGKVTMIVVAHRLSTLEKCDQILKLDQNQ